MAKEKRNVGLKYYTHTKLIVLVLSILSLFGIVILTAFKPNDAMLVYFSIGFFVNIIVLLLTWVVIVILKNSFMLMFSGKSYFLRQIVKLNKKKATFLGLVMLSLSLFFLALLCLLVFYGDFKQSSYPLVFKTVVFFIITFSLFYRCHAEKVVLGIADMIYNKKSFLKEIL
jgi:hypothetical protein